VLPNALQFMQLLWAVVHGLNTTSKRMNSTIGITGPQRLALRVVGLCPGLPAGELAAIMHLHPSTLTQVLERLVDQRLLERVDDPSDRRRARLRLTATGNRANAVRAGTVEAAVMQALREASATERRAAMRMLTRLARHLGLPSEPAV
jgi:DNA-binding MarR family transcriptional regulator